jgi:ribosome biogenesis GTPase A
MGFWPVVLNVLRNSDVVLMVVDARVPSVSRNSEIMRKCERLGKELVVVFNKIDLVSGKILDELRGEYSGAFFVSAKKKRGVGKLKKYLEEKARGWSRSSLRVGIVGYPNAGKSALINAMTGAELKVKDVSGTTKKTAWIRMGAVRIMDSPGVIPAGDDKVVLGLTASKDPHKMKNVYEVAMSLLRMDRVGLSVRRFYEVDVSLDDYDSFEEIGRKKGFLLKGGVVDENRTGIRIVKDWQEGKVRVE